MVLSLARRLCYRFLFRGLWLYSWCTSSFKFWTGWCVSIATHKLGQAESRAFVFYTSWEDRVILLLYRGGYSYAIRDGESFRVGGGWLGLKRGDGLVCLRLCTSGSSSNLLKHAFDEIRRVSQVVDDWQEGKYRIDRIASRWAVLGFM